MNAITQTQMFSPQGVAPFSMKAIVLALVVSAHVALLLFWSIQPHGNAIAPHELTVSFAMAERASPPALIQLHTQPRPPLPAPVEVSPQAALAVQPASVAETASAAPTAAVVADAEPDYKAAYLNNTPPTYPMVARRMGLQGKVVLNVEVLAEGVCGQINIHKSSGHAMLDNAALQAVKTWRFIPVHQSGQSAGKWFMIPIQFSLKDQAA